MLFSAKCVSRRFSSLGVSGWKPQAPWVLAAFLSFVILYLAWASWKTALLGLPERLDVATKLVVPYYDSDSSLYVHLVGFEMGKDPLGRVVKTYIDGGVGGRPVFFSQILIWGMGFLSWGVSLFSGWGWLHSVQFAGWFFSPLLFCFSLFLIVASLGIFNVFWGVRCLVLTLWFGTFSIQDVFMAGRPDHHGLLSIGLFLGVLFFFGPLVHQRLLRVSAVFSGIAFGLMLGPGTLFVLPFLGILVCAWALGLLFGCGKSGEDFPWRDWGIAAAVSSGALYLVTFSPGPWPVRLETANFLWVVFFYLVAELLYQVGFWLRGKRVSSMSVFVCSLLLGLVGVAVYMLLPSFSLMDTNYASSLRVVSDLKPIPIEFFVLKLFPVLLLLILTAPKVVHGRNGWVAVSSMVLVLPLFFWASQQFRVLDLAAPVGLACGVLLLLSFEVEESRQSVISTAWVFLLIWLVIQGPTSVLSHPFRDSNFIAAARLGGEAGKVFGPSDVVLAPPVAGMTYALYGEFSNLGSLYWESLGSAQQAHAAVVSSDLEDFRRILNSSGVTGLIVPEKDYSLWSWQFYGEEPSRMRAAPSVFADLWDGKVPSWLKQVGSTQGGTRFFRVVSPPVVK